MLPARPSTSIIGAAPTAVRKRLGVPARHVDERDRVLQARGPANRRSTATSSAASSAAPSSRTGRSSSATTRACGRRARSPGFSSIATPAQRQGILSVDVRDPRTGTVYPGGHADSDDGASRGRFWSGFPTRTCPATRNNYTTLQEFTADSNKAGGKVDVQFYAVTVDVRPLRLAQPEHVRSAQYSAAFGRRRQRQHLREEQAVRARLDLDADATSRCSKRDSAIRGPQAGKNPPALGSDSALDQFGLTGLPTDPRIAGGLPTQLITGYSDLGRQATNPQWQYPTVYNPKINYTWTAGAHSFKSRLRVPAHRHARCRT